MKKARRDLLSEAKEKIENSSTIMGAMATALELGVPDAYCTTPVARLDAPVRLSSRFNLEAPRPSPRPATHYTFSLASMLLIPVVAGWIDATE